MVRAPIPQIEEIITNELKSVEIPEDILASMNLEKTFAFPILFQVKSEAEMRKIIAKEKKEKEEKKLEESLPFPQLISKDALCVLFFIPKQEKSFVKTGKTLSKKQEKSC